MLPAQGDLNKPGKAHLKYRLLRPSKPQAQVMLIEAFSQGSWRQKDNVPATGEIKRLVFHFA